MRVTVTGGSGMLGQHLIKRLIADEHEVVSLDLMTRPTTIGHRQMTGDVRDGKAVMQAVTGADVVVHAAAALPSYARDEIRSVDVDGTRTVLDTCRRSRVGRVVHISSTAVYGLPKEVPTREDHPRLPVDTYSAAKLEAERLCERYREDGLCVPILRPKTFLGPHRLGLFSILFEWAEEGRNFPVIGRGDIRCQMLDVEDLVEAVMSAMTLPDELVNDTFNLGASQFTTLREDFQAVLDAAGYGGQVKSMPVAPAIGLLRALDAARLSPVYKRLIYKLNADSFVSIDRAMERLAFQPRHSNQSSLLRTFHWWQSQPAGDRKRRNGRTHLDPWRQRALALAKAIF